MFRGENIKGKRERLKWMREEQAWENKGKRG